MFIIGWKGVKFKKNKINLDLFIYKKKNNKPGTNAGVCLLFIFSNNPVLYLFYLKLTKKN